jgi:hypothetical protein
VPAELTVLVFRPARAARSQATARHLADQAGAMVAAEGAGEAVQIVLTDHVEGVEHLVALWWRAPGPDVQGTYFPGIDPA